MKTSVAVSVTALGVLIASLAGAQGGGRRTLTGILTAQSDANDQVEITIVLSPLGRPIFQYETSSGEREQEIAEVGQVIRFVPPGGGVKTLEVTALEVARGRIYWQLAISFEKAGTVLTQQFGKETVTLVARGNAYDATFESVTATHLSDLELSVGGNPDVTVYRGTLR